MKSRPDGLARGLAIALTLTGLGALTACGIAPPQQPAEFHCEDYDAAAERFSATCAPPEEDAGEEEEDLGKKEDAGTDEDAGDEDAGDVDAGDVDAGP